jgi:hypothetical protein
MAKDVGFAWIMNLNNAYSKPGCDLKNNKWSPIQYSIEHTSGQTVNFFKLQSSCGGQCQGLKLGPHVHYLLT